MLSLYHVSLFTKLMFRPPVVAHLAHSRCRSVIKLNSNDLVVVLVAHAVLDNHGTGR
jgi:hypothetical protein